MSSSFVSFIDINSSKFRFLIFFWSFFLLFIVVWQISVGEERIWISLAELRRSNFAVTRTRHTRRDVATRRWCRLVCFQNLAPSVLSIRRISNWFIIGQYQCFATNEFGVATSNSVFVRKSDLNSFKEEPALTLSAQEGSPFSLRCQPPDGWPKPSVYWMMQNSGGSLKSINSSRMTVDPEGTLWFSNVTRADTSDDFVYACLAFSLFRSSSYWYHLKTDHTLLV